MGTPISEHRRTLTSTARLTFECFFLPFAIVLILALLCSILVSATATPVHSLKYNQCFKKRIPDHITLLFKDIQYLLKVYKNQVLNSFIIHMLPFVVSPNLSELSLLEIGEMGEMTRVSSKRGKAKDGSCWDGEWKSGSVKSSRREHTCTPHTNGKCV